MPCPLRSSAALVAVAVVADAVVVDAGVFVIGVVVFLKVEKREIRFSLKFGLGSPKKHLIFSVPCRIKLVRSQQLKVVEMI